MKSKLQQIDSNIIARSMTTPPPVLSPNSSPPPPLFQCALIPAGKKFGSL